MGNLLDALQVFEGDPEDFYMLEGWDDEIVLNPEPVAIKKDYGVKNA